MHLSLLRVTTTLCTISTNGPRPNRDVSVRLILVQFEVVNFSSENKSKNSISECRRKTSLPDFSMTERQEFLQNSLISERPAPLSQSRTMSGRIYVI